MKKVRPPKTVTVRLADTRHKFKMCIRDRRISASENADIIDDKDVVAPLSVMEQDIKSYVCLLYTSHIQ